MACQQAPFGEKLSVIDMKTAPSDLAREASHPVVFFDGVCGLCNGFVDFTLARDQVGRFRFAALQGETFRGADLGETRPAELTSIVLWENHHAYIKSDAVLKILEGLGGGWALLTLLRLVPASGRDFVYDLVAENRYRWFGRRDTCRLPSPEEQRRFLP